MRALIVGGSGEMGRLLISLLKQKGGQITATYRFHRQKEISADLGCRMIPFEFLYDEIERCDVLLSATSSPHYVIDAFHLRQCAQIPAYMVDLAVPRDIEPQVEGLTGIEQCWNVDTLSNQQSIHVDKEKIAQIRKIHQMYIEQFYQWECYRSDHGWTRSL